MFFEINNFFFLALALVEVNSHLACVIFYSDFIYSLGQILIFYDCRSLWSFFELNACITINSRIWLALFS